MFLLTLPASGCSQLINMMCNIANFERERERERERLLVLCDRQYPIHAGVPLFLLSFILSFYYIFFAN